MRYWDTSALVPLVLEETSSEECRALLGDDCNVAVWALTRTEMVSAVRRKQRRGETDRLAAAEALRRVRRLEEGWTEIASLEPVRDRADRLLGVHALRAADALQLAATLVLCQERPAGWSFVTLDERLAAAAAAEGFEVRSPWPEDAT